jgi:glycosyltransferase involved in cell wall biosynthesis
MLKISSDGTKTALAETRNIIAGWFGSVIHCVAARIRWLVAARADVDSANIAVLCDPFLRYGSAQAIGLTMTGLNVTLYYVDRVNEFGDSERDRALFLDRAQAAGVVLVPLPRRRIRSLLKDTIWLHRDLRRRKIATAVVQWHIDPRYATLGLALPVALIVHDPQPHLGDTLSTFPLPVRLISRIAELTSFCLIVHSASLVEQIRPLLRRLPVAIVPHGADISPTPAPVPRDRRLVIFGRLFAYKGVDTALEAFSSLPDEFSDATLIVAGRGPLADLARGQRNVELYEGYVTDADADALLDSARLVLLPYKDATQSGVGLQAVSRGVPCIVSCAGALPELVQDSSPGLVVPPNSPVSLAQSIVRYIDHDETLRRAIHDHARTHFAWPVAAQQLRCELQRLGLERASPNDTACNHDLTQTH